MGKYQLGERFKKSSPGQNSNGFSKFETKKSIFSMLSIVRGAMDIVGRSKKSSNDLDSSSFIEDFHAHLKCLKSAHKDGSPVEKEAVLKEMQSQKSKLLRNKSYWNFLHISHLHKAEAIMLRRDKNFHAAFVADSADHLYGLEFRVRDQEAISIGMNDNPLQKGASWNFIDFTRKDLPEIANAVCKKNKYLGKEKLLLKILSNNYGKPRDVERILRKIRKL